MGICDSPFMDVVFQKSFWQEKICVAQVSNLLHVLSGSKWMVGDDRLELPTLSL